MVATFNVAGRQLAMITLGTFGGIGAYFMRGGAKKEQRPPINATSNEEEKFIKEFLEQANMDSVKEATAKH